MTRRIAAAVLAAAALAAGAQPAAAATPHSETQTAGQVDATLSWVKYGPFDYRDVHIRIRRGGRTVLDAPVPPPCAQCSAEPADPNGSLKLTDLDADGEPEAIVELYTGGAHCCYFSVIYGYRSASDSYGHLTHDWRDPSYQLVDIDHDGRPELRSSDALFAYEFTAYLFSALPVQIWHYSAGKLVDVTREFPAQVRHDVKKQRSRYHFLRRHKYDVRGAIAAYAADQYLLHRGAAGMRLVYNALRRGELKKHDGEFGPFKRKYVKRLRKFLHTLHYR